VDQHSRAFVGIDTSKLRNAVARELSAFIWAINREVVGSHATANQ
jgi:hypothetical protein